MGETMQKYDNGKASIETMDIEYLLGEKEYIYPNKRNGLEKAFQHTLEDALRMKLALEEIIHAADYTNAGENCKVIAKDALGL